MLASPKYMTFFIYILLINACTIYIYTHTYILLNVEIVCANIQTTAFHNQTLLSL